MAKQTTTRGTNQKPLQQWCNVALDTLQYVRVLTEEREPCVHERVAQVWCRRGLEGICTSGDQDT